MAQKKMANIEDKPHTSAMPYAKKAVAIISTICQATSPLVGEGIGGCDCGTGQLRKKMRDE